MSEIKSKTGTALITGSGSKVGVESAALKWTVSLTQPPNPSPGDLWVKGDPNKIKVEKVIHLQTNQQTIDSPVANTIYILIPAEGYTLVETPVSIRYFENEKYRLQVMTPKILVTGNSSETLEIERGVYTGTEWKMWGVIPDKPSEWEFLQAIAADTTWTPPNPGQWYRIHVFGKCGSGGYGTFGGSSSESCGGGAGGNSGGYSCSIILLEGSVPCTINGSVTSFGDYLSATSGGNGSNGNRRSGGAVSSVVGKGSGGTEYNLSGFKGGAGGNSGNAGNQGGNKGARGGGRSDGGGGGGGARLPTPYDNFPYVPNDLTAYRGGAGGSEQGAGGKGSVYPALNLSAPKLYGGGCAGGGEGSYESKASSGTANPGSPGLIIIEKEKGV